MKKTARILCAACIVFFSSQLAFSQDSGRYVRENLRLRAQESTASTIIATMNAGTRVRILQTGTEDTIDAMHGNWVQIEVIEGKTNDGRILRAGTAGWCFDGYLSGTGRYDYIDLSDRDFSIQKIDFRSAQDAKAWRTLAGYYFVMQPRETIPDVTLIDTPWGKDYGGFGHGCHSISYQNGKWIHGGDGEATEYSLVSVSPDGKTFGMKGAYTGSTQTWKIEGDYLYIGSMPYYKITGPDCYKRFIKSFVKKNNDSVKEAKKNSPALSPEILSAAARIAQALAEGNIDIYETYADAESPVNLIIADYRGNTVFTKKDLQNRSDDVLKAFNRMKADLSGHRKISSMQPEVNAFIRTAAEKCRKDYPRANVLVEYLFGKYESLSLFLNAEGSSVTLIGIKEYGVFLP